MSSEVSPEREKIIIEAIAKRIVDLDLEEIAEIALEGTKPFGTYLGEMGFMMGYAPIVALFGHGGHDFAYMMGFDYTQNAERILERVKELSKEKKEAKERDKKKLRSEDDGSWLSRLKRLLY